MAQETRSISSTAIGVGSSHAAGSLENNFRVPTSGSNSDNQSHFLSGKTAVEFSSSEEDSDGGDVRGNRKIDILQLQAHIFSNYEPVSSPLVADEGLVFASGLSKIQDLLVAAKSGATTCMICLEKVRITDPIWDCRAGCYVIFHLICIQSWAQQSLMLAAEKSLARLSSAQFPLAARQAAEAACWHCPKCRTEYPKSQMPQEYRCFCGKEMDPAPDPWLSPHTCGERCGRSLQGDCGHTCTLLCHPGPCPPCPQLLQLKCFCGAKSEMRRCGRGNFSCDKLCNKQLGCGKHSCEASCHAGPCQPCKKMALHRCKCGSSVELRACAVADFQCELMCAKMLSCNKHQCKTQCHSGPCGDCQLQGRRGCPCGKVKYDGIDCDAMVPTCGSTCEKQLHCMIHRCPERCHYGPCIDTCRILINKFCRCGSLKKEVPCYQDLQCERKCQNLRNCTRHQCKRRCCDGNCPPCLEVCGRKLRCGNHKCPAPCHRGLCAPCPVTVRVACACGSTFYNVPCGTDKNIKPPHCTKRCLIPVLCVHAAIAKPHRCHYGACAPCQLTCNVELPCGHKCKSKCHGPRPPPNPLYKEKIIKKKKRVEEDCSEMKGSPCQPCLEMVVRDCLGKHIGGERMMPCSEVSTFSCAKPCGNLLACGNHYCGAPCHEITLHRGMAKGETKTNLEDADDPKEEDTQSHYAFTVGKFNGETMEDTCDTCSLKCQKKRNYCCPHPCSQICHPGSCPPCKSIVKRACHCGALVNVFDCGSFLSLTEDEQLKLLSCGGPCHRKMPSCSHLCPEICHQGPCPLVCHKKVTVRCPCQRRKREWLCSEVQAAQITKIDSKMEKSRGITSAGLLACDKECENLARDQEAKQKSDQIRQRQSEESQTAY
ncbi:hypothetical protein O6H91_07G035000 [Diphasiastrum complanatum]|uniref:Uncharacterized protein n=1 Tax=Diphasiastrum complanatum TaxID=34168 RepID=A0ACC2D3W5_DIPCM|nr:hypothetical protein O6H91_07G035000 [Diphasiastrum complanatum]